MVHVCGGRQVMVHAVANRIIPQQKHVICLIVVAIAALVPKAMASDLWMWGLISFVSTSTVYTGVCVCGNSALIAELSLYLVQSSAMLTTNAALLFTSDGDSLVICVVAFIGAVMCHWAMNIYSHAKFSRWFAVVEALSASVALLVRWKQNRTHQTDSTNWQQYWLPGIFSFLLLLMLAMTLMNRLVPPQDQVAYIGACSFSDGNFAIVGRIHSYFSQSGSKIVKEFGAGHAEVDVGANDPPAHAPALGQALPNIPIDATIEVQAAVANDRDAGTFLSGQASPSIHFDATMEVQAVAADDHDASTPPSELSWVSIFTDAPIEVQAAAAYYNDVGTPPPVPASVPVHAFEHAQAMELSDTQHAIVPCAEHLWFRRSIAWDQHCERAANRGKSLWSSSLRREMDRQWFEALRLSFLGGDTTSNSVRGGRTDTRAMRMHIHPRWHDGLCLAHDILGT